MWANGRYFRVNNIDHNLKQCDSSLAGHLTMDGTDVDYIGLLVDMVEVEYRDLGEGKSNKVVLFYVDWFKDNVRLDEQCLFYKVDTSQDCGVHDIHNKPFISFGATEQIFFTHDHFDEDW
jgi:hypothetical protein